MRPVKFTYHSILVYTQFNFESNDPTTMSELITTFPCLFTTQKRVKRPKWKEGELRVNSKTRWVAVHAKHLGSGRVEPASAEGGGKYMEPDEFKELMAGREDEFETEAFKVQVEVRSAPAPEVSSNCFSGLGAAAKKPAMKKFMKPAAVAPKPPPLEDHNFGRPNNNMFGSGSHGSNGYDSRSGNSNNFGSAENVSQNAVASWFLDCPADDRQDESKTASSAPHHHHHLQSSQQGFGAPHESVNKRKGPQKLQFTVSSDMVDSRHRTSGHHQDDREDHGQGGGGPKWCRCGRQRRTEWALQGPWKRQCQQRC
jgi:hypothetical protein